MCQIIRMTLTSRDTLESGNDTTKVLAGMDVWIVEEDGHIQAFGVHFLNHGSCRSVKGLAAFRFLGFGVQGRVPQG